MFTLPSVPSVFTGARLGRRSSISRRTFRNKSLDTATSVSWKVTYHPWLTTFVVKSQGHLGKVGKNGPT